MRRPARAVPVLRDLFCPRHPALQMTESGRHYFDQPIMHCAECVATMRGKIEVLRAMPYRFGNGRPIKQIVLPPVAAWER